MRTWTYWVDHRKPGQPMDLEHYNAIGTLRQALSQHANEAYDLLNKREKQIGEAMFKALTEKGAENTGIRRPTKVSTLASISGVSEDEVEQVVNRFREPGRSLLMPPHGVKLESDTVVDISHESLMRIWDRLKQWLEEESKSADMYLKLSEASQRFQEGKASLWQMPDLQLALNWREENKPTLVWGARYNEAFERAMVFLETSEKAYLTEQHNKELLAKRKTKAMRITALVLGLAAMICLFFVVYGWIQTGYAEQNALEAEKNMELAQTNAAEAERQAKIAIDEAAEAERQRNRAELERDKAEEARLEAVRQEGIANDQRGIAEGERVKAEAAEADALVQRDNAQEQERLANIARDAADSARAAAVRLRYQSIAQSMAVKAKKIPDAQLKGLIAKQGFDYYAEHKEDHIEYNGDIYEGSYYGLQGLIVDQIYQANTVGGKDAAKFRGDSILNQFHGHKPKFAADKKVDVRTVTFSQDGQSMYSAGGDGRLLRWNFDDRSFEEIYKSDKVNREVIISPNERWLALATEENEIDLFDLNDLEKAPKKLQGHKGAVYDLVFFRDNSGFVSIGADKKILTSDFNSELELTTVTGIVKTLAISPDGKTLAAGALNGEIILIDLENPQAVQRQVFRKDMDSHPVQDLSFSNDGRYLAIGGYNNISGIGYVRIWDVIDRKPFGPELVGFTAPVEAVEFAPDDRLVAAASRDRSVRFWDMANIFDLPTVLDDHTDWVFDLSFHPSGDYLVTASADGLIRKFPTKPDEMVAQLCGYITRTMSDVEWRQYVADPEDIAWVETCIGKPKPIEDE
jgi:WD40 repeat protein